MFRRIAKLLRGELMPDPDWVFGPDSPPDSPFRPLVQRMREAGVKFDRGRTHAEIDEIAERIEVPLPRQLREFWATAWPVGERWWDWRKLTWSHAEMTQRITDELQFHVESGDVWLDSWGERPPTRSAARERVAQWVAKGPPLLPLFGHRFILCDAEAETIPVLSIYSSDWIFYGWDLCSYLEHEFLDFDIFKVSQWPEHHSVGQWREVMDFGDPVLDEDGNETEPAPELPPVQWED